MRELTEWENKVANASFAECDIESGTASNDRKLFKAGFLAGIGYAQSRVAEYQILIADIVDNPRAMAILERFALGTYQKLNEMRQK